MKRTILAVAALLLALTARPAAAQPIGSYSQPQTSPYGRSPVSPYLNLARGGNPGINYYGIVRPQLETERFIQQQEFLNAQQHLLGGMGYTNNEANVTGHATRFLSYSQYFLTQGGGVMPGGIQTGTSSTTATVGQALPQRTPGNR